MERLGARVFCKVGAEGMYCAALPELGLGVAIKMDDGNNARAAEVVLAAVVQAAPVLRGNNPLQQRLLQALPFKLTDAQQRVSREIAHDLAKGMPMLRLLQGDVGSGKTLVAVLACLQAVENGYQAALMAPTEILAEQHFLNLDQWLTPLGIEIDFLSGKVKGKKRQQVLQDLQQHLQQSSQM
jgi:RecG-like helicase